MLYQSHRRLWAIALTVLMLATLACNGINQLMPGNTVETVQAAATQAGDVDGAVKTLEAAATDIGADGLAATAEALATEANVGDVGATAEALATEAGLGDLAATAEAAAGLGDVPEDIPVVDAEVQDLFAMESVVSYFTPMDYSEVVDFYKTEMINQGWEFVENNSIETQDAAVLNYDKPDRSAIVTISRDPTSDRTSVQVLIQTK